MRESVWMPLVALLSVSERRRVDHSKAQELHPRRPQAMPRRDDRPQFGHRQLAGAQPGSFLRACAAIRATAGPPVSLTGLHSRGPDLSTMTLIVTSRRSNRPRTRTSGRCERLFAKSRACRAFLIALRGFEPRFPD